jgi:hypothetical protein
MPRNRHHELPARLEVDYYRKQAKDLLRAHRAGNPEARSRAAEVLGSEHSRFLLTDAVRCGERTRIPLMGRLQAQHRSRERASSTGGPDRRR